MDVLHHHQESSTPYINLDYQHSSPNNSPHQLDSFDSFDFNSSPPFPHTPSYNGSYQNSPYSANSELSFSADQDNLLFDDDHPNQQPNYDPSEYDNPNTSSLLMFNDPTDFSNSYDHNQAQLSLSLPSASAVDHRSPHSFDYSSPSSNGGAESGPEEQQQQLHLRSRGSSLSDTHRTSPRLDVAQTFENMRFESPNWGSKSLPLDRPLSPPIKPLSPPQLRIPPSPISNSSFPPPPTINAPSGDGGLMSGPQLHIVPATPVSGGGAQTQPVQFQSRLETLRQDVALTPRQPTSSSWNPHSDQITISDESQSLGVPQFGEQAQVPFTYSHESSANRLRSDSNNHQDAFLFPLQPRHRSKSDTSLQHPQWNQDFMNPDHVSNPDNSALDDNNIAATGTINLNDVHAPSSADAHQSSFPQQLLHHFNFGDPSNNFLSPDAGVSLRRSKSDSGSRPGHQRQSRSEDIRSPSSNLLFPPSSQQDFINRQYLHPQQESLPAIRGRHHRRASSGSRGISSGHYPGGGPGGGSWSNSSSQRPSPYPSPNPSPHARYNELPNVALTGRHAPLLHQVDDAGLMLQEPNNARAGGQTGVERTLSVQNGGSATTATPIVVSRPNVTTGRTANASHKRRKQEATFSCPVPNCGSTFTRSFNLKGHLRSHNEEKPFQCHWPGCGKGFARQHDCKRHEQLHTNYRPYTCEGCSKPFARMDALNRHLRSEGGAECQKTLAAASSYHAEQPPPLPVPKTEVDGGWGIVL